MRRRLRKADLLGKLQRFRPVPKALEQLQAPRVAERLVDPDELGGSPGVRSRSTVIGGQKIFTRLYSLM